jgi:hypothetical protein
VNIPPTPAITEVVVEIIVELISALALETKEVKQGRLSESLLVDRFLGLMHVIAEKFVKKLRGDDKVEHALQRLDN